MTREEAIQYIDGLHYEEDFPYTDTIADFVKERNEAIDMAIEALSADTVEVVRCKDCHWRYMKGMDAYCPSRISPVLPDYFCNKGITEEDFREFGA